MTSTCGNLDVCLWGLSVCLSLCVSVCLSLSVCLLFLRGLVLFQQGDLRHPVRDHETADEFVQVAPNQNRSEVRGHAERDGERERDRETERERQRDRETERQRQID